MKNLPKVVRFDSNKHLPQSAIDKTSDLFYLLSTLYLTEKTEKNITKLSLEKTLFTASQELANKNHFFLNTFFYINTYGPHNSIIYQYLEELEKAGLIEVDKNDIYLTPKGLGVMSELTNEVSENKQIVEILLLLEKIAQDFIENPSKGVSVTHSLQVTDTTDDKKTKTIEELIKEIKPEQKFKASQFKYIEPVTPSGKAKKINVPSKIINQLETSIANIEEGDFEKREGLQPLFA